MSKVAAYPGSFDPLTNGHLDILERSLKLFDEVRIVVAGHGSKQALMTLEERVAVIQESVSHLKNVSVDSWNGLIMDYAEKNEINAVVRGLRAASDFEYEFMMASMNKSLNSQVETVFMMTSKDLYFVSSSMIKELFKYGGEIKGYVPSPVERFLKSKFPQKG